MRKLLPFIILILVFGVSGQTAGSAQPLTKEQKKQAEREEKEALKRPAQIVINAPLEKVNQLLVVAFQSWNYQIDEESPRRLVMSKEVPGIGNKILAGMAVGNGGEARYKLVASFAEVSGMTSITVNFALVSQNAFGKTNYASLDKEKKLRREVDPLLRAVKLKAEQIKQESKTEQQTEKIVEGESSAKSKGIAPTNAGKIIVEFTSDPTGAEIYIDGEFVGSAPSKISVEAGEHTIKIMRTGYKEWERKIKIGDESTITLNAMLEKIQ
jgi:hypothetical protein